jgi:tetratricopeptide (TPR) repeat protein
MRYYRAASKSAVKLETRNFITLEMVDVLFREKRYEECLKELQNISEDSLTGSSQIKYLNIMGKLRMYHNNDFNGALSYFRKSYENDKNRAGSIETLIGMAECYRRLGLKDRSLKIYSELVKLYPDSATSQIADSFISHLEMNDQEKEESLTRLQESFEELADSSIPDILPREEFLEIASDSTVYSGQVTIRRHNLKLEAKKMVFDRKNNRIKAEEVTVSVPAKKLTISGANATYNLQDGTIFMEGEARISSGGQPEKTVNNIGMNIQTGEILTAASR